MSFAFGEINQTSRWNDFNSIYGKKRILNLRDFLDLTLCLVLPLSPSLEKVRFRLLSMKNRRLKFRYQAMLKHAGEIVDPLHYARL